MNKVVIHDRKTESRSYRGQADAEFLIGWLNRVSARNDPSGAMALARIDEIIDAISQIGTSGTTSTPKQIRNYGSALNLLLTRYEFVYSVDYTRSLPFVWALSSIENPAANDYIDGETLAVHHLVELAKKDVADRVRKCECGLRFFARLPAQRFHEDVCRVRFWEQSAERQARRREKAREYYHLKKSGKVK